MALGPHLDAGFDINIIDNIILNYISKNFRVKISPVLLVNGKDNCLKIWLIFWCSV